MIWVGVSVDDRSDHHRSLDIGHNCMDSAPVDMDVVHVAIR